LWLSSLRGIVIVVGAFVVGAVVIAWLLQLCSLRPSSLPRGRGHDVDIVIIVADVAVVLVASSLSLSK